MQTIYGFCNNGVRRVTQRCLGGGKFICPQSKSSLVECAYGCACGPTGCDNPCLPLFECRQACDAPGCTAASFTGCTGPLRSVLGPCELAPRPVTTLEACRVESEARWVPETRRIYDECGAACATCIREYVCNRSDACDARTRPPGTSWRCDAPACVDDGTPLELMCGSSNLRQELRFLNSLPRTTSRGYSGKTMFVRFSIDYQRPPYTEPIIRAILLQPGESLTLTDFPYSTFHLEVQANLVGDLANPNFFTTTWNVIINTPQFVDRRVPPSLGFRSHESAERRCVLIQFLPSLSQRKDCRVPTFQPPSFGATGLLFEQFTDPLDLLNGATFQISSNPQQPYIVVSDASNITGFQSLVGNPKVPFTLVRMSPKLFILKEGEFGQTVRVATHEKQSNLFTLGLWTLPDVKDRAPPYNQARLSFFAVDPDDTSSLLPGLPTLPLKPDAISLGVDNARCTVASLDRSLSNNLLARNPDLAVACCIDRFSSVACTSSKFASADPDEKSAASADCSNLLKEYCAEVQNQSKVECACFPKRGDTVDELITKFLENGDIPAARSCTVPACKSGFAYVPASMRQADCSDVCAQIQKAVVEGNLRHIDFKGTQDIVCGSGRIELNPGSSQLRVQTSESSHSWALWGGIGAATAVVVVVILITVTIVVVKRKKTARK